METLKKRPDLFHRMSGRQTAGHRPKEVTMKMTRVQALLPAIPVALMLALTACGSDGEDSNDDVASVDGSTPDGSDDSDGAENNESMSEEEHHDMLLEYAQCLRDEGLDVDDPAPGEGIQLRVEGDPSQSDAALQACEDKAPPPPPGSRDEGEDRERMLAFATCMRENGVEKFKDPKEGEGIGIGPEVAEDPDFKAAEKACNEEIYGGQPDSQGQDA